MGEAVKKSHEALQRGISILGNTVQYVAFNDGGARGSYLLIVSQEKQRIKHPQFGHNIILTATSYYDYVNNDVADSFKKETGIDLSLNVPPAFNEMYQQLGLTFRGFERNPEWAMRILTRR